MARVRTCAAVVPPDIPKNGLHAYKGQRAEGTRGHTHHTQTQGTDTALEWLPGLFILYLCLGAEPM